MRAKTRKHTALTALFFGFLFEKRQRNFHKNNRLTYIFDMSESIEKVKTDLKGMFEKIKGIKNIKIIALVFIIAIALIIYSNVVASDKDEKSFQNDEETRLASILSSVDGAGEVETMITKSSGQIVGVLVIATGANNPLVRLRLLNAASSALGIDSETVSVMSRKN